VRARNAKEDGEKKMARQKMSENGREEIEKAAKKMAKEARRSGKYYSTAFRRAAWKTTRQTIHLLLRVFVAAVTFIPSHCLAPIGGIHIQTHRPTGRIYEVRR
jgi:hypothetical protein